MADPEGTAGRHACAPGFLSDCGCAHDDLEPPCEVIIPNPPVPRAPMLSHLKKTLPAYQMALCMATLICYTALCILYACAALDIDTTPHTRVVEDIRLASVQERRELLVRFGGQEDGVRDIIARGIRLNATFGYTISSTVCEGSSIWLLVYVHSAPDHFRHREAIRNTWGDVTWYRKHLGLNIRVLFVVAHPSGGYGRVQRHLLTEARTHGDLLQLDFTDSYHNLTYKAMGALRWITKHCAHVSYVMKTDDDVFVNMPMMLQRLRQEEENYRNVTRGRRKWFACRVWEPKDVDRCGRWEVPNEMYPDVQYPPYCQGAVYVMTFDVAAALQAASHGVPFLWVDDAYITGAVRELINVTLTPLPVNPKIEELNAGSFLYDISIGNWTSGCVIGYDAEWFGCLWRSTTLLLSAGARLINLPRATSHNTSFPILTRT